MKKPSNECSQDLSYNEAIDSLSKMCNKGNINLCPLLSIQVQKISEDWVRVHSVNPREIGTQNNMVVMAVKMAVRNSCVYIDFWHTLRPVTVTRTHQNARWLSVAQLWGEKGMIASLE